MIDAIPMVENNLEYQELNYMASLMYQIALETDKKVYISRMDYKYVWRISFINSMDEENNWSRSYYI